MPQSHLLNLKFIFIFLSIGLITPAVAQSIDSANYYVITNVLQGENKAVTGMVNATLGNAVMLRGNSNHPMQQWSIIYSGNGNYRITNRKHGPGQSLDVVNDGVNNNRVTLAPTNNLSGQFWKISKNTDGTYRITSLWQGTDKALDFVKEGDKMNQLILMPTTAQATNQAWRLKGTPKPKPVALLIPLEQSAINSAQSLIDTSAVYQLTCQFRGDGLAMEAVSNATGIRPMLKPVGSNLAQYWKFVWQANGAYRLNNIQYRGKSLDIINDGQLNYNLTLAPTGDYSGQFWKITRNDDGNFWFTSLWQGEKSLDVLNAGNKDELIINATGKYSGQLWKLTKRTVMPVQKIIEQKTAPATNDRLISGQELKPGVKIVSSNGSYALIQQEDGNLVIYNKENQPIWASDSYGKNVKRCVMQKDGNLVQYLIYDVPVWASNTNGNDSAYLVMQDDGNLVIYSKDNQPLWSTNTVGK